MKVIVFNSPQDFLDYKETVSVDNYSIHKKIEAIIIEYRDDTYTIPLSSIKVIKE